METPLARRFPGLDLPRLPLAARPTPVEPWPAPEALPGGVEPWLKREDRAAPRYGGNKVRKLEFLLAEARARGARRLLTVGAVGSHHVLATALYGRERGLAVEALLVPHPDTPHTRANARVLAALLDRAWPCSEAALPLVAARALAASRRRGPTRWIAPGGSSPLGTLGAVDLGLEIGEDVAAGRLPEPSAVVVALGSGGTAAGLLLGLHLAGLAAPLLAVRVVEAWKAPRARVLALARRAGALLPGRPRPPAGRLVVIGDQLGRGYGWPTRAGEAARALAAGLGLPVEETYTAKALAGCLAAAGDGPAGRRPLFVLTANGRPLDGLPAVDALPPRLARLLRPVAPAGS